MPPLICTFATRDSEPHRIESFIRYLEGLAERDGGDETFAATVQNLIERAHSWLSDTAAAGIGAQAR